MCTEISRARFPTWEGVEQVIEGCHQMKILKNYTTTSLYLSTEHCLVVRFHVLGKLPTYSCFLNLQQLLCTQRRFPFTTPTITLRVNCQLWLILT